MKNLSIIFSIACLTTHMGLQAADYFVASDGLDTNSGTIESPFLSISKATELATAGDNIYLRGGTYTQTIDISGLTGTAQAPITISAYQDEQVQFDGTKTITELGGGTWTLATTEFPGTSNIYKTTLTEDTWQLFVDKKIQIPARWPNANTHPTDPIEWQQDGYEQGEASGYLAVEGSWWHKPSTWANADAPGTIGDLGEIGLGYNQTENNPGTNDDPHFDLAATGKSFAGGTLIYSFLRQGGDGNQERLIETHAANTNILTHAGYTGPGKKKGHAVQHKYFIIEHLEALDKAGEWYYLPESKTLYLWPENNQNPSSLNVHGRVKTHHLVGAGKHVTIKGLNFFAGTFQLSGDNLSIQDSHFSYPDATKRILGLYADRSEYAMDDYGSVLTSGDHFLFQNNIFEHSEMGIVLGTNVALEGQFINNLFQYISMWGFGNNALIEFAPKYVRNTVRYSGMRSPFKSTGAGFDASLRDQSYNRLNHWGLLQVDDGSGLQVAGDSTQQTIRKHNWFLRTPMYGARWDGQPANFDGVNRHSVSMGMRGGFQVKGDRQSTYNNTAFNSVRDIGKNISQPIEIGLFKNDIIVVSNINYGGNDNSITQNNLADSIAGERTGHVDEYPIPGTHNHNWNGYLESGLVENMLVDPENLDFRPKAGSPMIDAGLIIPGITDGYLGAAPDIGAYEYGSDEYWIAGYQAPQASTPIPGDGAVNQPLTRDLMYLPGYEADEVKVYFGTDIGSLSLIATRSNPDKNILVAGQDFTLNFEETYYWRVDTILADSSIITGDVWTFSTSGTLANGLMLAPVHDTFVNGSNGTANYGSDGTMRIQGAGYLAYLKFDVSGIGTRTVNSATLRLTANSTDIPDTSVYLVTGSWDESSLNSDNDTLVWGQELDTVSSILADSPVDFNVLSAINGDGTYSFGLSTTSQVNGLKYLSKEGSVSPKLIIQYEGIDNTPPVWNSTSFSVADGSENVTYSGDIGSEVSDNEDDVITYSKVSGPAWLVVSGNGILSGMPATSDIGSNVFTIRASDFNSGSSDVLMTINVLATPSSFWIAASFVATDATATETYSGNISDQASDERDDNTFSKVSGPDWLSVNSDGSLFGSPAELDTGANSFIVRASGLDGAASDASMTINVLANPPPVWNSASFVAADATATQTYSGNIGDQASDTSNVIAFSKVSGPDWLSVASDGSLSGSAQTSDTGENSFIVRATDLYGASSDASMTINVKSVDASCNAGECSDNSSSDSSSGGSMGVFVIMFLIILSVHRFYTKRIN
ncbi:putative Ig domain-containing protein [Thalassotalea psychrophila]|uniref:Ig domain-containing protein n=1 Tax=Thalassotalea psychrophila TaxID=3065647 RepID=A0ABY9TW50_9GAMM|nr:putative Ig domain-containing protein [Colwelliaceae bacterium SQ149]